MDRRNALQWQVFYRLGYCLSGVGLLSSGMFYNQAIANAQMPVPVRRATNRPGGRHAPLARVPQGNVAPPESAVQLEVGPQSRLLEVPAATVAMPTAAADTATSATVPPLEALHRATDEPTAATVPVSPSVVTDMAVSEAVVTAEPSTCPTVELPPSGQPLDPACQNAAEAATVPIAPTLKQAPAAIAKSAIKQITQQINTQSKSIDETQPVAQTKVDRLTAQVNINAQRVMTKPVASPIRVGPISLSGAGISLNTAAVKPYFNPQLRLPQIPGIAQLRMVFPIAVPAPITSSFGWRTHPISGTQRFHTGTDIGAPMGTPVMAAMSGRVILADNMGGYGISVAIEHDNGIRQTLYAHMSEIFVRPGDVVQQGTVIGRVGSTGASTGPHLHFELRQMLPDGTWVAQDVGQHLNYAMAQLVQSIQLAQSPQRSISQVLSPLRNVSPAVR